MFPGTPQAKRSLIRIVFKSSFNSHGKAKALSWISGKTLRTVLEATLRKLSYSHFAYLLLTSKSLTHMQQNQLHVLSDEIVMIMVFKGLGISSISLNTWFDERGS